MSRMIFGLGSGRSGTMSLANLLNAIPNTVCFHESNPASMAWSGAEATVHSILNDFENILSGGPRGIAIDLMAPHRTDRAEPMQKLAELPEIDTIGDVASYYLPYAEMILERCPNAVFPCLKRNRDQTVHSFANKVTGKLARKSRGDRLRSLLGRPVRPVRPNQKNHWVDHDGKSWRVDLRWDKCFPSYDARLSLRDAIGRYYDEYYARASELSAAYPNAVKVFDLEMMNSKEGQAEILDFCGLTQNPDFISSHLNQNKTHATQD